MDSANGERHSRRLTKGKPPRRLEEWVLSAESVSQVSRSISSSSATQRRVAESELAAAEEIAELERQAEKKE